MQKLLLAAVFMASMQFAAAERAPIAIPKKYRKPSMKINKPAVKWEENSLLVRLWILSI